MAYKFSVLCAVLLLFSIVNTYAQFTLSSDDASAYTSWVNNSNEGFNFSGWTFGGNASTRSGIASSTNNGGASSIDVDSKSFYLLDADNSGLYIDVFRFLVNDLKQGQTFSIDLDVNFRSGFKGIRVRDTDDATSIFRFEIGNPGSGDDHIVYDASTGNGSVGNSYSSDTQFTIKLKQTSTSGGTWTITRSGGISDTDTGTYSGSVSSFQLYSTGAGSSAEQAIYYNNLSVTTDTTTVDLTGSAGFRLMSAPVTTSYSDILEEIWTQGASAGADVTNGDANVFSWNNGSTSPSWESINNLSTSTTAGKGFLVYVYADDDNDGSDNAFPKTLSVSGTEHSIDVSPTLIDGQASQYFILGNPYATTIDFDNVTKSGLTNVAYVWDPNNSGGDGGTDANGSGGSWKTWNGTTGDLSDGLIAPFQGFFVQATTGTPTTSITFGASSKGSGGSFLGKTVADAPVIRFEANGRGLSNSAFLQFGTDGSATQRVIGDAEELSALSSEYKQLAFIKGGELYDIANIGMPGSEISIPLHFNSSGGGDVSLRVTDFGLSSDYEVQFHDYEQEVTLRVDADFEYNFDTPVLKTQAVPALTALKSWVTRAKVSDEYRFGITIRPTSVSNETEDSPAAFALEQNYPNPFNPSTTISYSVQEAGAVTISVYNLMGQKVATLVDETKAAGQYNVRWNAAGAASGMYYYRLEAGGQSITRKMTLIK